MNLLETIEAEIAAERQQYNIPIEKGKTFVHCSTFIFNQLQKLLKERAVAQGNIHLVDDTGLEISLEKITFKRVFTPVSGYIEIDDLHEHNGYAFYIHST